MTMIVSSCAFETNNVVEMIQLASENNLTLEFSSGIKYTPNLEEIFLNAKIPRFLHNYFPPPKIPFVINLASADEVIRRLSINHCLNGLMLAKSTGSNFFSAHAGFCIDVEPKFLGNPFPKDDAYDRFQNMDLFIDSIEEIISFAEDKGMIFCIENNVVSQFNISSEGKNPFLCGDPDEILYVLNHFNSKHLALLLDTGHLKVSAKSLGFDLISSTEKLFDKIYAVHHNENDALTDTNMPLDKNYWFSKFMPSLNDQIFHVLEVKNISLSLIKSQIKLLESMFRKG